MTTISFISEGFLVYSMAFLTLMPDYLCNSGSGFEHCSRFDTCSASLNTFVADPTSGGMGYSINWNNKTSLNNLVEQLDLRCTESWKIGMLGSCYFFGAVLGNLFLSSLGDTVGRIIMMRIGLSLSIVIYTLVLFISKSMMLNYLLLTMFGALTCFRVSVSFLYG